MKKILCTMTILAVIGCQGYVGPLERSQQPPPPDPLLTPFEQAKNSRYNHAYIDDELGPRSGLNRQDNLQPHGQ